MQIFRLNGKSALAAVVFCLLPLSASSVKAQSVVTSVPMPFPPGQISVDPYHQRVYVADELQVSVVNEANNQVIRQFPLGENLSGIAINPATARLYVTDMSQGLLYILDAHNDKVITTLNIPDAGPIAVNLFTNRVYVSDFEANLYVIDGATNQFLSTIPVNGAHGVAVNPFTNRIYVAEESFPGAVAVIDGNSNQQIATAPAGGYLTYGVAVDVAHNVVYATNEFGSVGIINAVTNSLTASIPVGGEPGGVSADPFTEKAYVSSSTTDSNGNTTGIVQIISGATNMLTGTVPAGSNPLFNDTDFYRGLLYVGDLGTANSSGIPMNTGVTVINTR